MPETNYYVDTEDELTSPEPTPRKSPRLKEKKKKANARKELWPSPSGSSASSSPDSSPSGKRKIRKFQVKTHESHNFRTLSTFHW